MGASMLLDTRDCLPAWMMNWPCVKHGFYASDFIFLPTCARSSPQESVSKVSAVRPSFTYLFSSRCCMPLLKYSKSLLQLLSQQTDLLRTDALCRDRLWAFES